MSSYIIIKAWKRMETTVHNCRNLFRLEHVTTRCIPSSHLLTFRFRACRLSASFYLNRQIGKGTEHGNGSENLSNSPYRVPIHGLFLSAFLAAISPASGYDGRKTRIAA
tara:strand:- start:199 stop:525 length:327 start_codon:yes stop_codon:yes gene_type:complete